MRAQHICPKCGGTVILVVPDVARGTATNRETGEPLERFDAYVCERCLFAELYAEKPIVADGERVRKVGGRDVDTFDDLPETPEDDDGLDGFVTDWSGDNADATEVSRVEKKPGGLPSTRVILVHLGPRPGAVVSVLRDTLGLAVESEASLRELLPFVVMDLVMANTAQGLRKLLEDAGATVELHTKHEG
jgi:ribosomal protein L7/L12/predicted nucleic-acid-binding Zn-ribbon protein